MRSTHVSDGWWCRFLECQPKLSLGRGDATAHIRLDSVNNEAIQGYYNLLEDTLCKHSLLSNCEQIYNMDESGMPLDPCPPNVVVKREQKKLPCVSEETTQQFWVVPILLARLYLQWLSSRGSN